MRQVVQSLRTGAVDVLDVPPPQLRPGGALVLTKASLISAGTERSKVALGEKSLIGKARARPDLARQVLAKARQDGVAETYRTVVDRLDAPGPLGYSAAGVVVEVGPGCHGVSVGDLVACAGGGYANHAELNFVPQNLLARAPDGVRAEGAAFATLGAIAMQGVRQGDVRLGDRVVVIGLGLVGLLTVQLVRAAGGRVLAVDVDPAACALADAVGAELSVARGEAVEAVAAEFTAGNGADVVLICASTPEDDPIVLAGRLSRDRGRVVVVGAVGMGVPRDTFYEKELDLRLSRSYGPGRYDPEYEERGHDYPIGYVRWTERRNLEEFMRLVGAGVVDVESLTTHRFAIEDAADAYATIVGKGEGRRPVGVLLMYGGDEATVRAPRTRTVGQRPPVEGAIGLAAIGAGSFATRVLLPAFTGRADVEPVAVASAGGVSAQTAASRFGFSYAASDAETLFADGAVVAVVVATRHDSHASLAAQALRAGKAVFCEKPLATTSAGLEAVAAAYEASGAPLFVGFNRRYSPHTRAVAAALPRHVPRAITCRVNAGPLPAGHWTKDEHVGGGRIVGELCHFLDLACALAEGPPVRVAAEPLRGGDADEPYDTVLVQVSFACGSVASLQYLGNGDPAVAKERVEVYCGGVVAEIDDFRTTTLVRGGRSRRERTRRREKGHAEEVAAFVELVRAGGDPGDSALSAFWSSALTLQVVESLQSGRPAQVELPNSLGGSPSGVGGNGAAGG